MSARLKPGSQNSRILAVLADGHWHTTAEIHRLAGFSRLNSRIAEINGRPGYTIEHDGAGGGAEKHRYRLVATPRAEKARTEPHSPAEACFSAQGTAADTDLPAAVPGQLTLEVAA
jgi:hypothetical protein